MGNQYNLDLGIVHLAQVNNTLSAEIDIAACSTQVRYSYESGKRELIQDEQTLIRYSWYGNPGRNSDPHIGGVVNSFARNGYHLSLGDPLGLYILFDPQDSAFGVNDTSLQFSDIYHIDRGDIDHILRLRFEAPEGKVLQDVLQVDFQELQYGGQISKKFENQITRNCPYTIRLYI